MSKTNSVIKKSKKSIKKIKPIIVEPWRPMIGRTQSAPPILEGGHLVVHVISTGQMISITKF